MDLKFLKPTSVMSNRSDDPLFEILYVSLGVSWSKNGMKLDSTLKSMSSLKSGKASSAVNMAYSAMNDATYLLMQV